MPNSALRRARTQHGWSQAYVARELGTDARTVSRWERGVTSPSPHFRTLLCDLFQLDIESLGLLSQVTEEANDKLTPSRAQIIQPIRDPLLPRLSLPKEQCIERESLLQEIMNTLSKGTLCALYGLPGIGKTTLAQMITHHPELDTAFPDGILWINLGPKPDVASELVRLATLLGVPEDERRQKHDVSDWSRKLQHITAERRLLLIIDDAWTLDAALPFLFGGSRVAHLLTTRLPEVAFALPACKPLRVPELDSEQSRTLLSLLLPQFSTYAENVAQKILRYADGLPLAVTLLGHYLYRQTIGGQRRRIEAAMTRLADAQQRLLLTDPTSISQSAAYNANMLSLETVIALSDQQLPTHTQYALRAISLLPTKPDSFSEAVASAVCEQDMDSIDCLLDAGLLEGAGEGRYWMHQAIADYGRQHLEDKEVRQRLMHYALRFCQQYEHDTATLSSEYATLLTVLKIAQHMDCREVLIRLVLVLDTLWNAQGRYQYAEQWLREAWDVALKLQESAVSLCDIQFRLGNYARFRGEYDYSRTCFQGVLALSEQHNLPYFRCQALHGLALLAHIACNFSEAKQRYTEVLLLAQELNEPRIQIKALNNLGIISCSQGEFQQAEQAWLVGLEKSRECADLSLQSLLLGQLAELYKNWFGRSTEAESFYHDTLALAQMSQDTFGIVLVYEGLGELSRRACDHTRSLELLQLGLTTAEHVDYQSLQCSVLAQMARTYIEMQQLDRAEETLIQAKQLLVFEKSAIYIDLLFAWGELWLARNNPDEAENCFLAVENELVDEDIEYRIQILYGLARVAALHNAIQKAMRLGSECVAKMRQVNHWQLEQVQSWLDLSPCALPLTTS